MSAARYRQFLKLCESWPLDVNKKGRDIGERIRTQVAHFFRQGESTTLPNEEECDQKLESLQKIQSDYYRNAYRTRLTGSLKLSLENLREINSNKIIEEFSDKK